MILIHQHDLKLPPGSIELPFVPSEPDNFVTSTGPSLDASRLSLVRGPPLTMFWMDPLRRRLQSVRPMWCLCSVSHTALRSTRRQGITRTVCVLLSSKFMTGWTSVSHSRGTRALRTLRNSSPQSISSSRFWKNAYDPTCVAAFVP